MSINKDFYQQSALILAKKLLGKLLIHRSAEGTTIGRIVETEAYLAKNDPACHASRGMTKRNEVMFESGGVSYVYLIYGMYYCFNVVSGKKGKGEAVLIRALEPISGIELMMKRRNKTILKDLCNGPGKLVIAMGIDKTHNNSPLDQGELFIDTIENHNLRFNKEKIVSTTRIGIKVGSDLPYRFYLDNNQYISKK